MNFFFIEEIVLDIIDENCVSLKCTTCQKPLSSNSSLKRHMELVHDAAFFTKNHFFLTSEKKIYACPKCSKTFANKSNVNKHILIHDNNTYACNQCENKYEYKPSLIRHQKVHENPEDLSCTKWLTVKIYLSLGMLFAKKKVSKKKNIIKL